MCRRRCRCRSHHWAQDGYFEWGFVGICCCDLNVWVRIGDRCWVSLTHQPPYCPLAGSFFSGLGFRHISPSPSFASCLACCRAGLTAWAGRRNQKRTAYDFALDAKHHELASRLRAKGGVHADGPLGESHLLSWQAEGWRGQTTGSRWWSTSWGSRDWSSQWSTGGWRSGYEPRSSGSKGSGAKGNR